MSKEKKIIKQPDIDAERELDSVLDGKKTYVKVRDSKWAVTDLYNGTKRKLTHIMLSKGDEDKVTCKCAAALRLNGYWSILLFYWFVWRWFYYVKQYRDGELVEYIAECKKKVGAEDYVIAIILLTGMKDTMMAMTREEVMRFQAEQLSAQLGHSQKNTQTSVPPNTTSED